MKSQLSKRIGRGAATAAGICSLATIGCKSPTMSQYSPQWEVKTTVASSDVPIGVSLEKIEDAPMPSPEGANPLLNAPQIEGPIPADGSPPLPGNWTVRGGVSETSFQVSPPGTPHPAEPPMPESIRPVVRSETLLAAETAAIPAAGQEIKPVPVNSSLPHPQVPRVAVPLRKSDLPPVVEAKPVVRTAAEAPKASASVEPTIPLPATVEAKTDLTEILLLAKEVETKRRPKP